LEPPEEARTHVQYLYLQEYVCVCGSNWAPLLKHKVAYTETVKEYDAICCIFRKVGMENLLSSFCGMAYRVARR